MPEPCSRPRRASTPPRLRVRVAEQRAVTAARLRRIVLRVRASAPGLALIRARARGRLIAEGLEPLFTAGTSSVRLAVTRIGWRLLRRRGPVAIAVTARARDLVAHQATVRASALNGARHRGTRMTGAVGSDGDAARDGTLP
jgi:hypothetical protein